MEDLVALGWLKLEGIKKWMIKCLLKVKDDIHVHVLGGSCYGFIVVSWSGTL